MRERFDVLVIGGGHAGVEAAAASARMGVRTLLVTQNLDTIGQMSCNPAIGGLGKSQLVREVDALDGVMARAADQAAIQVRVLNRRKGPAVRATRAQTDRMAYRRAVQLAVFSQPGLNILQGNVERIWIEGHRICGVVLEGGGSLKCSQLVLTTGTFLAGRIHMGKSQNIGGRAGEAPSLGLSDWLRAEGFRVGRLKTGTPPRIDGRTIHWSRLESQPGEEPRPWLSELETPNPLPQVSCYQTHTTPEGHKVVHQAMQESPIFSGAIQGAGPRYCPSIEDKVARFPDRDYHTIFIEPEGLYTTEVYPNGVSTSLPREVQEELVTTIPGLEEARLTRYGYAIEYDFLDPRQLEASLAVRGAEGFFLAGQINGTTGYEEAAAQGILAGTNAALRTQDREVWCPERDIGYLGVMVDDLITRGVDEPYRMFTSRAEYRLLLREDNADSRLTPLGRELGLVGEERWMRFCTKARLLETLTQTLEETWVTPQKLDTESTKELLGDTLSKPCRLADLVRRPQVGVEQVGTLYPHLEVQTYPDEVLRKAEIELKYAGYIERDRAQLEHLSGVMDQGLPEDLEFTAISGLSAEVVERLEAARPRTLAQASRIQGVTPAALSLLSVHAKRHFGQGAQ